ncbi:DUF3488 and DUF4129 domain-containing transglutaminase family protein [Dactylosporangium siamense]|uniref:Transglutaminase n=1 Tax=Dactylosporangium siamense TaxID=685454 RepID=A0A919UF82_9ACTN|nr:DUF3488 and transglutaminase-like domain-containing protein [Dactylosporangium siamense]GIG48388.1 transglutaminase [Dactylosporangium siamense]
MSQDRRLTLVAAGAALLAALPVTTVFDHATWAVRAALVVAAMCGAALLAHGGRAPRWAPGAAMALAGLLVLTWLFPSGREYGGVIPAPGTFAHFGALLRTAGDEMRRFAAPVSDRESLLFVAVLGVAVVAWLVDLFAVVLRRPALAGLPMLAVYSVPVAVTDGSTSWWPFVLGAVGFLWLLVADNVDRVRRFGRRFSGDGHDLDPWQPSPLAAAGQRLGAVGVGLAVLVPLVPFAMPGGALDRLDGWGAPDESRSVSMLAEFAGRLRQGPTVTMVTVTNTTEPDPYYLRLNTLDRLTERGFAERPAGTGRPVLDGFDRPAWDGAVTSTEHRADIVVSAGLGDGYLPIYAWPSRIDGVDRSWTFDPRTTVVSSRQQTAAGRRYSLTYARPDITPEDLRGAAPLDPTDPAVKDMLAVPANATARSTVAHLVRGKATQLDKVTAIREFFSTANDFRYDTGVGPDIDIDGFLRTRHGFCVQYAAAFGWLLREAGIPSRVAIGFARGVKRNGGTVLTNRELHAWTEVYFPGFGWLPFDATPPSAISGSADTSYVPGAAATGEPEDQRRGGPAPGPTATGNEPTPGPTAPVVTDPGGPGDAAGPSIVELLVTAGPWALVLLLLLSPAAARRRARGNRLARASSGSTEDAARSHAHHAWDELIDTMLDYRLPVRDTETPRATVERLVVEGRLHERARAGVRQLNEVEEHARYARRPLEARELRSALGAVREDLAGHASAAIRIRAVLLPPSVLRRWRAALHGGRPPRVAQAHGGRHGGRPPRVAQAHGGRHDYRAVS